MTRNLFSNRPATTVTSGGTDAPAAGTSQEWTVASSSGFPAASDSTYPRKAFHIADRAAGPQGELIKVTNVSGTSWTVERGADGTTPVAHTAGFGVRHVVQAGWLQGVDDAQGVPVFDVQRYGAVADGVTNDYAAIDAAIQACNTAGGGIVYFPPGSYAVSTNGGFQVPVASPYRRLALRGAGPGTTDVIFSGTGYLFNIGDGGVNDERYVTVEDMTITGTATNPDGAVNFNHQRFCGMSNVWVTTFAKAGAIGVNFAGDVHNYFALITNCRFVSVPTGIKMDGGGGGIGANSNHVRQCHFGAHTSYAVHILAGDTNTFEYNEFNGSVTTAVYVEGTAANNKFLYNQFDGPTTSLNLATSGVTGTLVIGNSGSATITDSGVNTTVLAFGSLYARNGLVIGGASGNPATIPLRVRGASGQSTQLFAVQDSTGTTTYLFVDQSGNWDVRGSGTFHSHTVMQADVGGNSVVATVEQQGSAAGAAGLRIKQRSSGTTGDMLRLTDSDGTTVRGRINKDGYFGTMKTSAPADADINTSEVFLWLDATAGTPKLMAKGKDSAGTVFSHQLSP